jgi:hypothetical protein
MSDQSKNPTVTAKPAATPAATPEVKKVLTPEEQKAQEKKDKKRQSDDAWLKARNEIKDRLIAYVGKNKDTLGTIGDDILALAGKRTITNKVKTGVVRTINAELKAAFLEKKTINELDIFRTFHIGRPEMAGKIRAFILAPKAEDKIWIKLDEAKGDYIMVGTGANTPADWDGFLPAPKTL